MAEEALSELGNYLKDKAGFSLKSVELAYGELTVEVEVSELIATLTFLRDDAQCQFISLIDISGVDYPSRAARFDVVYHLLSPRQNLRIRVKVATDEDTPVVGVLYSSEFARPA